MKYTPADIRRLRAPGKYNDGQGLILHVITADRRNWILRYMRGGKERMMGLGSAGDVSLDEAREKAQAARKLLAMHVDPIDNRRAEQKAAQAQQTALTTFTAAASAYIAAHEAGWRNAKHGQQWTNTLAADVEPVIGAMAVAAIDTEAVLRVLTPIWQAKSQTAARLRERIEKVLSFAIVQGWREGPNPAVWRGHLQLTLPAPRQGAPDPALAALDWREAPAFMAKLREQDSMGALALQFAILTGEALRRSARRDVERDRPRARGLDDPRLEDEDAEGTPRAAVGCGGRAVAVGRAVAHRGRSRVPRRVLRRPIAKTGADRGCWPRWGAAM